MCMGVAANAEGDILPHHLEQIIEVGKNLRKIE